MPISNPFVYLAENSADFFFIYDLKKAAFSYLNPAAVSLFNNTDRNPDEKTLLAAIHAEDRLYVLSKLKSCIDGEHIAPVNCRINTGKDQLWLRIKPYLSKEEGENLIIGHAEDITIFKENIDVLNNHNIKKNSILSIITHDLAGPISTINSIASLMARDITDHSHPKSEQYINLISKISKSSLELIRNFMEREFLESTGVSLMKTRVKLSEKIRLAAEDFLAMRNELQINFSCTSNTDDLYIEIDEDKFMQVINNLISNSLKFTSDGGHISIHIQDNEKDVIISVADDGIGIPEKYHATLFDKFNHARRSGLRGEQSTGLGMSIIKTIVEWHNGKIWFASEENKGTTFYIQLPKS